MLMDTKLIGRLIKARLHDRGTYVVAAVVGTLINGYGHLLVPWFRTASDPFALFVDEFQAQPGLTLFSIFLAYAFPMCVGIYSAVAARYKLRRIESIADFPERKPDPVFRANMKGELVEIGAATQQMFQRYRIDSAQSILGEEVWAQIVSERQAGAPVTVYFAAEDAKYLVHHVPTANDEINIYLTRLVG